jgi:Family of unknown function (DUF6364)
MSKLTLSIDSRVVLHAKRAAAKRGISVSSLAEPFLALLGKPEPSLHDTPVLAKLRGSLRAVDMNVAGAIPQGRPLRWCIKRSSVGLK